MRWLVTIFSTGVFLTNIATGTTRTTPPTLVPRLQILTAAKAEHDEPGFDTPRRIDTFPKGTVQPARKVESKGITYWVFPIYRFGLDTAAPRTAELCFRFDESKTIVGIGVLGYNDLVINGTPETLSCTLSTTEGVYCVEDRRSAHDMQAGYWPVGTLLAWQFLIFWEEE